MPASMRLGRALPVDLERLISSCLARDVLDRPQSAEALSERLLSCQDALGWSQTEARFWWQSHKYEVLGRQQERARGAAARIKTDALVNGEIAVRSRTAVSERARAPPDFSVDIN